jgi:hypothetical protein
MCEERETQVVIDDMGKTRQWWIWAACRREASDWRVTLLAFEEIARRYDCGERIRISDPLGTSDTVLPLLTGGT